MGGSWRFVGTMGSRTHGGCSPSTVRLHALPQSIGAMVCDTHCSCGSNPAAERSAGRACVECRQRCLHHGGCGCSGWHDSSAVCRLSCGDCCTDCGRAWAVEIDSWHAWCGRRAHGHRDGGGGWRIVPVGGQGHDGVRVRIGTCRACFGARTRAWRAGTECASTALGGQHRECDRGGWQC